MRAGGGNGTKSISRVAKCVVAATALCLAAPIFAGFASMETYLPAVGRIPGKSGAQFYTTIWATNLTGSTVHFTFYFLAQNQANPSPASFADTLAPGETKVYENVVETKLGLISALGAARVVSDGEILVSERIYNQEPGDDLGKTEGLFFAGVPKGFSIAFGESASIQGINQGGAENFRYNFALVETGGASATAHVVLYDGDGHSLGAKDYILQAYEQIQPNVDDLSASLATTNARITATVTAGAGSILLAGAQLANESQDSSGFEMSFRDDLLGGGGGGGLSAVSHDGTLVGNGTSGTPLGINPAAVVTSVNSLHGAVTLSAGANVTITPSGQTLTIAASGGGGGGLTLPFSATASSGSSLFFVTNSGGGAAIEGDSQSSVNPGLVGRGAGGAGLLGTSDSGPGMTSGSNSGPGAYSVSSQGHGVVGVSSATGVNGAAIYAQSMVSDGIALYATNNGSDATVVATNAADGVIYKGFSNGGTPVFLVNANSNSVEGDASGSNTGVSGSCSGTGIGVLGVGGIGVYGRTNGNGDNKAGYFEGDVTVTGTLSKGGGSFKIDHPLDPANKYLYHSFVESPDMMNIYDGVATLDESGSAVVALPDWFEALNRDFRYQLTSIGTPQPGLYVAREVEDNAFAISGGVPGARVSWQVTGIRHDAFANAHRIPIEQEKTPNDRGRYLHPELFGHTGDPAIGASAERPGAKEE